MASKLNKNRIRYTKFGLIATYLLTLFSAPAGGQENMVHAISDSIGGMLVVVCVLGRLYCTAFLGGHKNKSLIAYGPFSIVRNPLYFFSFVGVCGMALISNHLLLMLTVPAAFLMVYVPLIKREEIFLLEHFGEPYRQYCQTTPRLFPRLRLYQAPETVMMCPQFMLYALRDSIMWLGVLPLFELVEEAQRAGLVQPLFTLL